MTDIKAWISHLNEMGVKIWTDRDRLRYKVPRTHESMRVALRQELKARKAEIMDFLNRNRIHASCPDEIPLLSPDQVPVPAPAQQRLWFLSQLEGKNAIYNIVSLYRITGALDLNAFGHALNALVLRHDSLRLIFPTAKGKASVKKIPAYDPLTIETPKALTAGTPEPRKEHGGQGEKQSALDRWMDSRAQEPFDLEQGPLFRVFLLSRTPREHFLVFSLHHIIGDAWSMGVLIRDLGLLYNHGANARTRDLPVTLAELPAGYLDYAAHRHAQLEAGAFDPQLGYWMGQLDGIPELLELPTDFPRPARMRYRGKRLITSLSRELTQTIKTLGRKLGTTDFMTLLSAFTGLLYRYTGQADIVVGSPIANRTRLQTEEMVGLFANTLPYRIKIDEQISFVQLLARVKQTALDAYQHQDIPFETLVEHINPSRSMSHSPLYQVMFMLQNAPESGLCLDGLDMAPLVPDHTTARLDLTLEIIEENGVFTCGWEYNTDLFSPETIARMAGHLGVLLEAAVTDPDQPVSGLPLLTEKEAGQWLAWNHTQKAYPGDKTLVDLFQRQAEETPDHTAVVFETHAVSFRELNRAANRLARHLMTLGVASGTLVGLCVDRSVDLVTGLLGILKAGGAYVPLDPAYPKARLQDILDDAKFPVLVSQNRLLERFSSLPQALVCLDRLPEELSGLPAGNPGRRSGPEQPAYVIYTSGSTGKPKGVMIGHQALTNFLTAMQQALAFSSEDRLLALTTISFDIAALELFLPLITGGRTVVVSRDTAASPRDLIQTMDREKITHVQATPATWKMLVDTGWQQQRPLTILTGGEALTTPLGKALLANSRQLFNVYGPTETTIWSSVHRADQYPDHPELIGRPMANTRIFILDKHFSVLPRGIPGELCIGGHGLAQGYFNRPELTSDRFVEVPLFGRVQRIYRTGDLARLRPDGNLEYLGRLDHQVKLRGFRIELGEIENVLEQHHEVKEAVVVLDRGENPYLAAYLTQTRPMANPGAELRPWLKERLPEYMIPAVFTVLDRLPLTPNGKIDRKALPAPRRPEPHPMGTRPRTSREKCLAEIWCQVLKRPDIGIFDNFFEQGGDSILSVQIVARAREAGLALTPRDLFVHQTIAELARAADEIHQPAVQDKKTAPAFAIKLDPVKLDRLEQRYGSEIEAVYPLSPMQQGMLFHWLHHPQGNRLDENSPGIGRLYFEQFHCRIKGPLDIPAFHSAWQILVDHHDTLRTAFCHDMGEPFQVVLKRAALSRQTLDWRDLPPDRFARRFQSLLSDQRRQGFDLARPPLMRIQIIQEANEIFRLVWNHHHLLMDGWCHPILFTQLFDVYHATLKGHVPRLPQAPPFRDYIDWLGRQDRARAKTHWQNHLAEISAPTLLSLGQGSREPEVFKEVSLWVTPDLNRELNRFSRQHHLTLNTLVQGAWACLLSRYSGKGEGPVVFGVTTSGRDVPISGIETMVGLFINTVPLKATPDSRPVLHLLRTIQADQQENSLFSYTALSDIRKWSRISQEHPLFETLVVFENYPVDERLKHEGFTGSLEISGFDGSELTNYPVTLAILPKDVLGFRLTFDSQRFTPEQMQGMLTHLVRLLEEITAHPRMPSNRLEILTDTEQEQIDLWNRTQGDFPRTQTVVDLIRTRTRQAPESIAIVSEDRVLSYEDLEKRTNQMARYLKQSGVDRETLVGICMDRSPEFIIGLLGILKAGGAYVPLDPAYPGARIRFMLEDAALRVVLTRDRFLEKLPPTQASVISLDRDQDEIARASSRPFACPGGPSDLAYVIYTSGSTGRPKGVMVEHKSLANLIHWHIRTFSIRPQDRAAMTASTAFDASGWEVWPCLSAGAALFPMDQETLVAPAETVAAWLDQQEISVAFIPTALAENLISSSSQPEYLRLMLTGGDRLRAYLPSTCRFTLSNNYGPTENTVVTTSGLVPRDGLPGSEGFPSIGRPIANTRVYILSPGPDGCSQVPPGLAGELCIAGEGLARGYLNRPELTAEKFMTLEIAGLRQRIYRTGDGARFRSDGNIEYLGRLDHQVNLRGFRIELSEIELNLKQHPLVNGAVALIRETDKDHGQSSSLAAYVTPGRNFPGSGGDKPGKKAANLPASLTAWLRDRLPAHMIPARIMVLEDFPLTDNGKIDRKALSLTAPEEPGKTWEPPRTQGERVLLEIWQEVLGSREPGIFDNFFEQGGDSILSIRIVARAREKGLVLNSGDLFRHQTVAELALAARDVKNLFPADQGPAAGTLCLAPIQQRFFDTRPLHPHHYNQAVLLEVPGDIDETALKTAWQAVLNHHDALRLRFKKEEQGWTGWYENPGELPWHVENLNCLPALGERADAWHRRFDLEKGPLARLVLFRFGEGARLLWCIHHLVVDGVSWRILMEDLRLAYEQALALKPIRLPQKTAAFHEWTRRLAAWKVEVPACFRNLPASKSLPKDNITPDDIKPVHQIRHHTVRLSREETRSLLTRAPAAFRTRIDDLLLTALMLTLAEWTGEPEWIIDLESHGRADLFEDLDISRTVGWFTSLYSLGLSLPRKADPETALKQIKEQLRQVPDNGIGYGVLRWLNREDLPQGQILFNYLGQFSPSDSDWPFAREESGEAAFVQAKPDYPMEINGRTLDGRLSLTWSYSAAYFQKSTILELGKRFRHHLLELTACCLTSWGYTPSDFPLSGLSQTDLDRLARQYGNAVADIYPLSPMQQGMLFHTLHDPEGGAYFEQFHGILKGEANLTAIQEAWKHLLERHPILRTAFCHHLAPPVQVVLNAAEIPIKIMDWRRFSKAEQGQKLAALLQSERSRGFDLEKPPLMRIHLIREGRDTLRLVLHHHHLLLDGWSLPILFTEFLAIVPALCRNLVPDLPPPPLYRSYIEWLENQNREAALAHWKTYLSGFSAPTPLPRDPAGTCETGHAALTLTLDTGLSRQLEEFSRTRRLTLSTLFQGAWAALLGRYSGEDDVVFGVTVSGRQAPVAGIDRMTGLFINTIPLRISTDKPDLTNLLEEVQAAHLENSRYGYAGLADIQNLSQVPNGIPLFETLLVFENYPMDQRAGDTAAGLELCDFTGIEYTNYPLSLSIMPRDTILLRLTYDQSRFSESFAERLIQRLNRLLEGMLARPHSPLSALSLWSDTEQRQMETWNHTRRDLGSGPTIVALFESQAQKTPDHTAVVFRKTALNYGDLNRTANRLARVLAGRGAGPGTLVGICMERSTQLVAALLGTLKAGAAYLPLDPEYPRARLEFMMADAKVPILLTHSRLSGRLPLSKGVQVIELDNETETLTAQNGENLTRQGGPGDLAYVIYTSGSTGNPKGVMVEHRALLNHMLWMQQTFHFLPRDRFLQKTPLGFDPSIWEFYAPLITGATLVMAVPGGHRDPAYLVRTMADEKITVLRVVPSLLNMLAKIPEFSQTLPLRYLFSGGEPLSGELVREVYQRFPGIGFHNFYGPTEAAIVASSWPCTPDRDRVAIGRPVANTRIFILDRHKHPQPPGIPGELCIAGKSLARGYLNRPELTAERFADLEIQGERLRVYKTGDQALWNRDGNLEFLGRLDHQVKLRGMRIEPGEIENELCRHPGISGAVVILKKTDRPHLAAYVTPAGNPQLSTRALRTCLKDRLPEFMIPATITILPEFPLTPGGKIDRQALPDETLPALSGSFEAPRTDTEQILLGIWQRVLGQPDLGIYDNFFEQGGDSILSIQIVAKARDCGLGLSPRDLFQHQTIAELTRQVRPTAPAKACDQRDVTGRVPLSPIQQRFFSRDLDDPRKFNQSLLLALPAQVDEKAMEKALAGLLSHHDALRLRFRREGDEWSAWIPGPDKGPLPFHVETLTGSGLETGQALTRGIEFWQTRFDLENGPLVRLVLFRMKQGARLFWSVHHLAVDGVSWRILLEDLETAYHQAADGQVLSLPPKTSSYKAWTERLSAWKDSPAFEQATGYWKQLSAPGPLPADHPGGTNRLSDTRAYTIRFSREHTRRLLTQVHTAFGTRINDILLTALMLTLKEWTKAAGALIDLEGHGRTDLFEELDLSRTVGWFTAIHPVALKLPDDPDPGRALMAVKEQLREVPDQGTGYGVARWLGQETLPQGQILFNYLGRFDHGNTDRDNKNKAWTLAPEGTGPAACAGGERLYQLEINGQVLNDRLSLTWTCSNCRFSPETIERLGKRYRHNLEGLMEHCAKAFGYTPSDFPLAGLGQDRLDLLTQRYQDGIADVYPLAPMQQGMLFHSLEAPADGLYVEQRHCLFKGPMDTEIFRRAWQVLMDRHPILRTAVCHDLGRPLQIVLKSAQLDWQVLDWRNQENQERGRDLLDKLLADQRALGFDLTRAPLMRIQMIRESDTAWRMVWHHHHLLMDGWCLPVLFGELFRAYAALLEGKVPSLVQVPPYRTYIEWLNQKDPETAKSYWQSYLKGFAAPTPLPLGRHSRKPAAFLDMDQSLPLSLSRELTRFSRAHHLTLNTIIQGAWAALLSRYTGEAEVLFGATTSGRQAPIAGIDRMIGLFINTLPLRVKVRQTPVLDLLRAVQQAQQQNDRHAYAALPDIRRWSEVPGGVPLFETLVIFENYPMDQSPGSLPGDLTAEEAAGIEQNNYPLTLAVIPQETLRIRLTFDRHRLSEAGMARLLAHFKRLLANMVASPGLLVDRLPLLGQKEMERLLAWNRAPASLPPATTLVERFEAQAKANPDRIALAFGPEAVSYADLNARANRLARHLKPLGVGPETLVGICMERSVEMIVAILGILKAGGAYVPLDPSYPLSRLEFILEDAALTLILSRSDLRERLPGNKGRQVVYLDMLNLDMLNPDVTGSALSRDASEDMPGQSGPRNLAYVIYTSGSTGKPKGCQITHANVTRLFSATDAEFGFGKEDVWTLFHSFAFDFSVWEIFGALLHGGKLVIPSFFVTRSPDAFYKLLADQKVTVLNQTPSAFTQLIRVDTRPDTLCLRLVIFGGEALDTGILRDWYARHDQGRPQLVNMYGITETTVHVTAYPLTAATVKDGSGANCIGAPIPHWETWVLDDFQQPVPVGVPGELYVAGAGLSRGYLNRPELTARRFLELSLFDRKKRLYRTGDRARRRFDGSLEYLGRTDHQVQLRGFRIELPEIESAIKAHEKVEETAVVLCRVNQRPCLAAYVTCRNLNDDPSGQDEIPGLIRAWLKTQLPDHMIPASITVLDQMPLTPNGKIDRKALPAPDSAVFTQAFEAPRTDTETRLLGVWRRVLKQPDMGIFDNFFEHGGDSILSIQIVARARAMGMALSPRDLFEHQTVADLSRAVQPLAAKQAIAQGPVTGQMPLTPIQRRFFSSPRPNPGHFNQAVMLKVPGDINAGALEQALDSILSHHDALRLRFRRHKDSWSARHREAQSLPWHIEDLRGMAENGEEQGILATRTDFWQASLDISDGPIMRMVLFYLEDGARLFWCIHHLVVDGVSWRILLEDLFFAYSRAAAGAHIRLPDKTTSFQQWAQGLYRLKKNPPEKKGQPGAGKEICWEELPQARPLPVDHPQGSNRIMDEQQHTIRLTPGRTRYLLNTAPAAFRTRINDILLTALMLTLRDWTGRNDALVDLESHGRAELDPTMDLSRTVGWFTSLFPQPLALPRESDPATALKSIKEQLRQVPQEGIGYGIRKWLNKECLPRGEILFNYLGQFDQVLSEAPWQPAPEACGSPSDPGGERDYPLEVNGRILDSCLSLTWSYSSRQYDAPTIENLGAAYLGHLEDILDACGPARGFTPSDFPLAGLNQEQLDLLARRYPDSITDIYPLSPMQQGMLFHSLKEPGTGIYFEQILCRLRGSMDIRAFHRAWQHLVSKHAVLRTAFCHDLDAPPLQLVLKNADLSWQVLDWRQLAEPEQRQQLDTLLSDQQCLGFDLGQAPLMRLHMIREGEDTWRMVWHHHHILLDGWSLPVLMTDLFKAYAAVTRNESLRPEQAFPYKAYIDWLVRQDPKAAARYWQNCLAGCTAPTALPLAPPAKGAGGYREVNASLARGLTRKLNSLSRSRRLTLNTLVQGAWAALLNRYTGNTDILFGVTTSGRQAPVDGIDRMVGLFINTLPLRIRLSQNSILEDLQQIQKTHQNNSQYAYTCLTEIQSLSGIPGGTPLFESILVFENYPLDDTSGATSDNTQFPGEIAVTDAQGMERTNYPITLAVIPGQELRFKLTYDTLRFRETDMEMVLAHLQRLMEGIAAFDADSSNLGWAGLPLLTPAEETLIRSWNRTGFTGDRTGNLTVTTLFQEQARKNPDRIALIFGNRTLTYGALDEKADCLAGRLSGMGVGPDTLVGIFLDRSPEMVIAMLGTLKAGGGYVPMDPDYPGSRLQYMTEDSGIRVLLSRGHLLDRLPRGAAFRSFCLDSGWEADLEPEAPPCGHCGPDTLAYAIYTSGSTGRPKGVMVDHGALLNHMIWMQRTFSFSGEDVFFQKTPFSFDASVWEFYAPLLSGGTLVMAIPGGHLDPGYMLRTIRDHKVTILQLVPTALGMMLEAPEIQMAGSLRCLFCGGEALPPDMARAFMQKCPRTSLVNLYGPTEATIDTTWFPVPPQCTQVAIGRPVDNMRVYILDQTQNLMPPGLPGELCIAGRGLARGYLNNPGQTEEKFVDVPILGKRQRLYKTGDLALWQRDGNLAYLGRMDHQVKFRGFRVELQEIESVLKAHGAVKDAVVSVRREFDPPRLAAYVIPAWPTLPGHTRDSLLETLLSWAGERLPAHMVPSSVTALNKFPLTPSGKTDRNSLPAPDAPKSHARFLAPRSHKELGLARIWENLLGLPRAGIRDNFFELGGHSLLAVRLASRIQQEFHTRIPISTLMQQPTIEALAESITETGRTDNADGSPLVPINDRGKKRPLFCVHPAGGTVFCYYDLARQLGENQPLYGLQALGIEEGQVPCIRMEEMAATYLRAIRSVQPTGPYQLAGWSFGGQAAFEMACQLQACGETVSLLAVLDAFMRSPDESPPEIKDDARLMFDLLTEHGVPLSLETLTQLSLDEQLLYVKKQGRQVNYFPSDIGLGELRRLFRVYKANLEASLSYIPKSRFSGKVILFKAGENPNQTPVKTNPRADLGWTEYATRDVRVIPARGHHHNMAQHPHVRSLAKTLKKYLEEKTLS